jgi:hypothetical protein
MNVYQRCQRCEKLFSGVNDTGEKKNLSPVSNNPCHGEIAKNPKFFAGVNDTAKILFSGVNDTGDKFLPVSTTPANRESCLN